MLRLSDLGSDGLRYVLGLATEMKHTPERWTGALNPRAVGCIFEKPSTRTRTSMAVAAHRLGMQYIELASGELQLSRGETVSDTGRVLSEYVDLLVIRTFRHERTEELAAGATVPVINGLSDLHHPCQGLADVLTLRERFGDLSAVKLAFVGDANGNICHSLLEAAAMTGITVVIAAPEQHWPNPTILNEVRQQGASVELVTDPKQAVRGAHAVYPEIWVPMDKESIREQRIGELSAYRVDDALMALADPSAVFMHCLPAFREQEVTSAVLDGPRSAVWQQASNRLHTSQALMHLLLNGHRS